MSIFGYAINTMWKFKASDLGGHNIISLWMPILGAGLLMASELPILFAIIALNGYEIHNFTVFGLVYAIFNIAISPIYMIDFLSIKFAHHKKNLSRVFMLGIFVSVLISLFILTLTSMDLFRQLGVHFSSLPERALAESQTLLLYMSPIFLIVTYRRFLQGVLIQKKQKSLLLQSLLIRMAATVGLGIYLVGLAALDGAKIAAISLSFGFIVDTAYVHVKADTSFMPDEQKDPIIPYKGLSKLFLPLAMTAFASFATGPMCIAYLSQMDNSALLVASFSIASGLLLLLRAVAMSYQSIIVSMLKNTKGIKLELISAFFYFGTVATILMCLFLAFMGDWYFYDINGLTKDGVYLALNLSWGIVSCGVLTFFIIWFRGNLIHRGDTKGIFRSSIIELVFIFLTLVIGSVISHSASPMIVCAISLNVGRLGGAIYLWYQYKTHLCLKLLN
jgi:hypothetical protein